MYLYTVLCRALLGSKVPILVIQLFYTFRVSYAMMVIDSVFFKDLEVFIWLGPITMVTIYNVTMVMLYTYHFRCVNPVLLIIKSTYF